MLIAGALAWSHFIKLAGSLSLIVSLPMLLVAFARYSRDHSFQVLRANTRFVLIMAVGSIAGTLLGGLLLGLTPPPSSSPHSAPSSGSQRSMCGATVDRQSTVMPMIFQPPSVWSSVS